MTFKPNDLVIYNDPLHGKLSGMVFSIDKRHPGWFTVLMDRHPCYQSDCEMAVLRLHQDWLAYSTNPPSSWTLD
jgi:hypothetical protein